MVALLAAGELAFRPGNEEVRAVAASLSAFSALVLLMVQHLYFSGRNKVIRYRQQIEKVEDEVAGFRTQIRAMERDRQSLRSQIETLSAHRELFRAATLHTSFEDFMDEVAGVVHDIAGGNDITVFLTDSSGPVPKAYYQLSKATELYLSFSDAGGVMLTEEMGQKNGGINAELLRARQISVTPAGGHIVVGGNLSFRGAEIGTVRLTLHHITPDEVPSVETIGSLIMGELGRVRLDCNNILETMIHRKPLHYSTLDRLVDLACPLVIDDQEIGVIKVGFDCRTDEETSMAERQRLLSDSAEHIARAIQSERIYDQAIKDGLTGLYNKRYMLDQLEGYFRIAGRHHTHLSLIMIDIDHFKNVNDTWGHLTGDIILREVSGIMLDCIRSCDLACRYGGEELTIILPEGSLQGSIGLAERLRKQIEETAFISDKGEELHITASFGVSEYHPAMCRIEDLIAQTDAVLYKAKKTGRNRVIAQESPEAPAPEKDSRKITRRRVMPRRKMPR